MARTILLLGASQDQLGAIRVARQKGLRTLVVDQNPNAPGFAIADECAVVSTRDLVALKALCDASRLAGSPVDGVLVMGSDIPYVVAALAEYLGVPGVGRETARFATHKRLMKECFASHGVPIPWFAGVDSAAAVHGYARERGLPLVIKPVDRAGSRGVFVIRSHKEIDSLFAQSQAQSLCGEVMVEEFLEGLQISTETIMWKGVGYTVGFADRNYEMLKQFLPNILENGGEVPSSVEASTRSAVEALVEKAGLALGVTDGIVKGDVVLTSQGPKMIEMATRLSGGDFSETLIPLGSGVDIIGAAIDIAMGNELDLETLRPKWSKAIINRYFFPKPGRLKGILGVDEVRAQPFIKKLEFWYQIGDELPLITSHGERFGVFIVEAETVEQAKQHVAWVYDTIRIVTDPLSG